MGIYEFNMLSEQMRYDAVFTQGTFVDTVSHGHVRYALYALDGFWVEISYDVPTNRLTAIHSFVEGHRLDRYSRLPKGL